MRIFACPTGARISLSGKPSNAPLVNTRRNRGYAVVIMGARFMENLPALTSLRFFAAAVIVFDHATTIYFGHSLDLALYQGVTFFFVLSGFILTYAHPKVSAWADARGFWLARFARIWPATIASMICSLACISGEFSAYSDADGAAKIALTAIGMQAWVPVDAWQFAVNSVLWSISAETFFYLSFPTLNKNLDGTWLPKLALCFAAILVLCGVVWALKLPTYAVGRGETAAGELIYSFPLARLFEFMLGMTAASLWRRGYFRIANSRMATASEVSLVAIILAQLFLGPFWYEWGSPLRAVFNNGFVLWLERSGAAPLYALLIVVFAQHGGLLSKALRHPLPVLGGEISFAIYLSHAILLKVMKPYMHDFEGIGFLLFWIFYSIVALGVAYAVWVGIEKPCRRGLLKQHKTEKIIVLQMPYAGSRRRRQCEKPSFTPGTGK